MSATTRNRFLGIGIVVALLVAVGALWFRLNPQAETEPSTRESAVNQRPGPATPAQSGSLENPSEVSTSIPMETDRAGGRAALTQRLEAILNEPDSNEWPGMLLDLMQTASMADVQALLAASDGKLGESPAFRDEMKAAAYERWFALDPAAALRAIDKATMSPDRKVHFMEVFLDDWSGREPDRVSSFLQEGELRGIPIDKAYGAIVRGASLAGAVALVNASLSRISDPKLHSYAVRAAARNLQRDHDPLFENWLAALPTAHQGAAVAESVWMLSDTHIERALSNLKRLEQMEAERVQVTRTRVVVKWAEKDPKMAADWVATQSLRGEEREALFADVLSVWFSKDQDVAAAWVESLIAKGQIDEAFMNRVATRL